MSSILRILTDFGDAAGWLIAAVVVFYFARHVVRENERAHADLRESIKANAEGIKANAEGIKANAEGIKANGEAIAALRVEVHAIATDVAVLRDRAER